MRDQLADRLRAATEDLHAPWLPPARLRRQAARRRRGLYVAVSFLVTAALAATTRLVIGQPAGPSPQPPPTPVCPSVNFALPDSEADVRLRIIDASQRGLAQQAATDWRNRRFDVVSAEPSGLPVDPQIVAIVRFGSDEVGKAWLIRAYLKDQALAEFDRSGNDGIVEVVLGPGFTELATPTQMRQSLAIMGRPDKPC